MKNITYSTTAYVVDAIENALAYKKPFSLIRLGDGENSILGYPEFTSQERMSHVLQRAFGVKEFEMHEILKMVQSMRESVKNSDVIGAYNSDHPNPHCSNTLKQLEYYNLTPSNVKFTEAGINLVFHEIKFYQSLLKNCPRLGLISCRPVENIYKNIFKIPVVDVYPVPQEHHYEKIASSCYIETKMRHYPDAYLKIINDLIVEPGQLFFVGAGPLGKIYCDQIKLKGGVALDVGAMFDLWAGLSTRTEGFMDRARRSNLMDDYRITSENK